MILRFYELRYFLKFYLSQLSIQAKSQFFLALDLAPLPPAAFPVAIALPWVIFLVDAFFADFFIVFLCVFAFGAVFFADFLVIFCFGAFAAAIE